MSIENQRLAIWLLFGFIMAIVISAVLSVLGMGWASGIALFIWFFVGVTRYAEKIPFEKFFSRDGEN